MKNMETSFACLELSSVAQGYRALDALTKDESLRVLEASVTGAGRFVILASGGATALTGAVHRVREATDGVDGAGLIDHEVIGSKSAPILEALYSLSQVPAEESVVVLECETLSGLLSASHALVDAHALKVIELKQHRGSRSGGYGFFTGALRACVSAAEDVRARLRVSNRGGDIVVIESPSETFRAFFNFSGEA